MPTSDADKMITILVVDDDKAIREAISEGLEIPDFPSRIITAHNAVTGLQLAKTEYPDLIILDMQMPLGNGVEVADGVRRDPSLAHTKIIMLTAMDNRGTLWEGFDHGIDDFMAKPFDLVELEARVYNLLKRQTRRTTI